MPRLSPQEYDALHRKRQLWAIGFSLFPFALSIVLATVWNSSGAMVIGVAATSIVLWAIWVTPRPWSQRDPFLFTFWVTALFAVLGLWVFSRDIEQPLPSAVGYVPLLAIALGFLFFEPTSGSRPLRNRQGAYENLPFLAAVIAYFSSSKGGADPMHKALMDWFHLSSHAADIATIAVRKTIHFGFYGVAGYLAFRFVIASRTVYSPDDLSKQDVPTLKLGWQMALPYVAILAAYDEVRQLFSPNRSGSALDFLLDMTGACFFIWVLGTRYHKKVTNP